MLPGVRSCLDWLTTTETLLNDVCILDALAVWISTSFLSIFLFYSSICYCLTAASIACICFLLFEYLSYPSVTTDFFLRCEISSSLFLWIRIFLNQTSINKNLPLFISYYNYCFSCINVLLFYCPLNLATLNWLIPIWWRFLTLLSTY